MGILRDKLIPYVLAGVLCAVVQVRPLFAQHNHFQKITTHDGLPSSCVYRSFEDSKGYLWYLTDKGICRYDGVSWKYFSREDGFDELGAFHIAEGPDGRIWMISLNFRLYYYQAQRFHKVETQTPIAWFDIDGSGTLHVISRLGDIFQVNKQLVVTRRSRPVKAGNAIIYLGNQRALIANHMGVFDISQHQTKLVLSIEAYRHGITPRMFRRRNGHVILPNAKGIYDYDPATGNLSLLLLLPDVEVFCFYEDPQTNDCWLGTFKGLYRFARGTIIENNVQCYLTDNAIFSVCKASNGNYYLSTKNKGVFIANFYAQHLSAEEGLKDETILYIRKLAGVVYLFGANGTIVYLRENNGRQTLVPIHGKGKTIKNVAVFGDSALVSISNELYLLKHKRLSLYKRYSYAKEFPPVINLKSASKTTIPVAALFNNTIGIAQIFPHFLTERLALYNDPGQYHSLVGALANKAYFQLDTGLTEITYDRSFVAHRVHPIHFVSDMDITQHGVTVSATLNRGVLLMRGDNIEQIGLNEGLASDFCNRVYVHHNVIWVCTNKGLSRIVLNADDQPAGITNFTSDNYLLDNEVNDLFMDGNTIMVATGKGISYFPASATIPRHHPQLFIEKVTINNMDIAYQQELILPYDHNNLNLFYVSPNSTSSVPTLYRYHLQGEMVDSGYTVSGQLSYGNLPPGKYLLSVQARNGEGLWSHSATMRIVILNPFWKTGWFMLLCALLVFLVAGLFIRMKLSSIRREHQNQYKLVQSELRALRLYMNPHFIFNALNSAYHYILQNESEKGGAFIQAFSKVIRLTMNYSSRHAVSLEEEMDLLHQYITLEKERLKDSFSYDIKVEPALNIQDTTIPPLIIQPFVENAIKYGLSGLGRKGNLQIRFYAHGKYLQCNIDDDGIGRRAAGENQSQLLREGTSTGIRYIQERLNLLIQDKEVEPVRIIDKYNGKEAAGTLVILLIPLL